MADTREAYWIKHYLSKGFKLLNIRKGGKTWRGYRQTVESNIKRSKAMFNKHHTEETKQKLSIIKKNDIKTMRRIKKLGKARKGKPSNRRGVVLSDEVKRKISFNSAHYVPKSKKLTFEQENKIIDEIKIKSTADLCKKYKVSQWVIYDMFYRRSIKLIKKPFAKINLEQAKCIKEKRARGYKINDLAKEYNVVRETITDILHNRRKYLKED